jgi:phosphoenolpyruvate---glycerone phosphotransferase subunit DhaL
VKAAELAELIQAAMGALAEHRGELRQLDAAIGDGDLGITVGDGAAAVRQALAGQPPATVADVLRACARSFARANPSTMSGLAAAALLAAARQLDETDDLDRAAAVILLAAAAGAIAERGGAARGDKTILDAMAPSLDALRAAPAGPAAALQAMISAAAGGIELTRGQESQRGRAAWVGERSIGHADGGAVAYQRLLESLAAAWPDVSTEGPAHA